LDGKFYQIAMENEGDINKILKGNPWTFRNVWFVVHSWDRKLDLKTLNFTHISHSGFSYGGSPFIANLHVWGRQ
jgi:hypothetical protein